MAEGTYEYECMRAELLGLEKPDYEEFMRNKSEVKREAEEEVQDTENLKQVDYERESLGRISGGLEELNSILKKTQVKISRFKASCGSITGLLRRSDSNPSASINVEETKATPNENTATQDCPDEKTEDIKSPNGVQPRKTDLAKALDKDVSKIDSMIEKAENAQYSMAHQRKQMKRFLD